MFQPGGLILLVLMVLLYVGVPVLVILWAHRLLSAVERVAAALEKLASDK